MSTLESEDRRIVAELAEVGIDVNSVYDLVNTRRSYEDAIPVLARLLPTIQNRRIREGVVRALAVKEAVGEPVARAMIREFEDISPDAPPADQLLKWAIANTLSVVAQDSVFDEVSALVRDRRHGKAREMLPDALARMKDPRVVDTLVELLGDDEVAGHAVVALGRLKARAAMPEIERFLSHPKPWVRREAERALAKIKKASQSRHHPSARFRSRNG